MTRARAFARTLITAAALISVARCARASALPQGSSKPEELAALFAEWRAFQRPRIVSGVPDYTSAAMAAQHRALAGWQRRAAAFEVSGWTIPQRVDLALVGAEMNGLDFDHRVLRPWAQNPAFYVTVFDEQSDQPAREGPLAAGAVELWAHRFPLTPEKAAQLAAGLQPIPALLDQARGNLNGYARDLWVYGI